MILENIISKQLTLKPDAAGWSLGSARTSFFVAPTPAEALEAWAKVHDPSILPDQQVLTDSRAREATIATETANKAAEYAEAIVILFHELGYSLEHDAQGMPFLTPAARARG